MTKRLNIIFEDGEKTYGMLDLDSAEPTITVGGAPYDLRTFAATGATVAINDPDIMKILLDAGIKARPTGKQTTITISVPGNLKDKLVEAGQAYKRTVTSILTEAAEQWIEKNM